MRRSALLLSSAFAMAAAARNCTDGGPFRCNHGGCPSGTMSCNDMRFQCATHMLDMVGVSDDIKPTDTVSTYCPGTCDPRCAAINPLEEVDFVLRFAKSRGARAACRHWQHVGCITHTLARLCEGEDWLELMQQETPESIWSCCCPEPHAPCESRQLDRVCVSALEEHIDPLLEDPPDRPPTHALLAARAELYIAGGYMCKMVLAEVLADEGEDDIEAPAACGAFVGLNRTIARQELHCELLTWRWEALGEGDGDDFQANGCPFNPASKSRFPGQRRSSRGTGSSKTKSEL